MVALGGMLSRNLFEARMASRRIFLCRLAVIDEEESESIVTECEDMPARI